MTVLQVKKPGPKPKPAAKPAESKDDSQVNILPVALYRLNNTDPSEEKPQKDWIQACWVLLHQTLLYYKYVQ